MKKKVLFLTLLLVLIFTSVAYAVDIMIDDDYVTFNDITGKPFIDSNGRTQVPLRATMETYGATVNWDDNAKIATIVYNEIVVKVPIGENYILKNGIKILNDTEAIIKDNRTYLPIRVVLEAFGSSVGWQNEFERVIVNKYRNYTVPEELIKMGFEEWQNAIIYNDYEALREMFTEKYNINSPNNNGTYPLEYAIIVNSTDMVKLMIDLGANTEQVNSIGQSMLDIAQQKKYTSIVKILSSKIETVVDINNGRNNIEWRFEGHESVYPYKEYERKYIDGVKTSETRYTGTNWTITTNKSIFNLTDVDIQAAIATGKIGYENVNKIMQKSYYLTPRESEYNIFIGDIYLDTPYLTIVQQSAMAGEYGDSNELMIEAKKINEAYSLNETISIPMTYYCSSYENPKFLNAVIKQGNEIYKMRIKFDSTFPEMTSSWPDFPAYRSLVSLFYDNKTTDKKIDLTKPAQLIIEHISGSGMESIFDIDFSKIK